MLRVVSFDLVGTLIDFYYEDYVWKEAIPRLYSRKKGISFERSRDYVLKEYDRVGKNNIEWYLPEHWFKRFGLTEDPIEVFRSHIDKAKFYPEVPSVLGRLGQKYDLVILSGTTRNIIEIMIKRYRQHFKRVYSTISDCRLVKKSPQFYEFVCRDLEIEPGGIVHVGDEWYSDFVYPRRVGIKSFYLKRNRATSWRHVIKDLRELEDHMVITG